MEPNTIGEHVRKRRLERHLLQSQLAEILGVNRISVQNWERDVYEPSAASIPKIIDFLGYDPRPTSVIP